ncbi:MAG: 50S ribosomal protein L10 [Treponemataceae bacterium]
MALRTKNPKKNKEKAIEVLTEEIKNASSLILTNYRGMTVQQMTDLRKKLRECDTRFKIVRNNFVRIALENLKIEGLTEYLVGPVALAFVSGEANEAAKAIFDTIETVPALSVKCALVDGEFYDAEKIEAYSKLPGKKELISMFMSAVNDTTAKFVRTLQAIVDKNEQKEA